MRGVQVGIYRDGFFKVSRRIIDSSLWCDESGEAIKVFITLLSLSQDTSGPRNGSVLIARKQLAAKCFMSEEALSEAIDALSNPDQESRTRRDDGRRIEVLPNGFRILNYGLYHDREKDEANSKLRAKAGSTGGLRSAESRRSQVDTTKQKGSRQDRDKKEKEKEKEKEKRKTTLPPAGDLIAFYNSLTGRKLTPSSHEKFIAPRVADGVPLSTLKLAAIGACLSAFHLGLNDRRTEYLDPETILRAGRLDGHAERARRATYRLERGDEVWAFWSQRLGIPVRAAMERFFRARDEVLVEEGGVPLGPAAAYASGFKPGDPWPPPESA